MRGKGIARPKETGVYLFGTTCWIGVFPQQKWKFKKLGNGFVELTNNKKYITFQITAEDFSKDWKEIEEDK